MSQVPSRPRQRRVPGYPPQIATPQRSMVNPMGARIALGRNSAPSASTWVAYGLAGLALGAALRMVFGAKR